MKRHSSSMDIMSTKDAKTRKSTAIMPGCNLQRDNHGYSRRQDDQSICKNISSKTTKNCLRWNMNIPEEKVQCIIKTPDDWKVMFIKCARIKKVNGDLDKSTRHPEAHALTFVKYNIKHDAGYLRPLELIKCKEKPYEKESFQRCKIVIWQCLDWKQHKPPEEVKSAIKTLGNWKQVIIDFGSPSRFLDIESLKRADCDTRTREYELIAFAKSTDCENIIQTITYARQNTDQNAAFEEQEASQQPISEQTISPAKQTATQSSQSESANENFNIFKDQTTVQFTTTSADTIGKQSENQKDNNITDENVAYIRIQENDNDYPLCAVWSLYTISEVSESVGLGLDPTGTLYAKTYQQQTMKNKMAKTDVSKSSMRRKFRCSQLHLSKNIPCRIPCPERNAIFYDIVDNGLSVFLQHNYTARTNGFPMVSREELKTIPVISINENWNDRARCIPKHIGSGILSSKAGKHVSIPVRPLIGSKIPVKSLSVDTENFTRNAISPRDRGEQDKENLFKLPEIRKRKSKIPVRNTSYASSSSIESLDTDEGQKESEKRRKLSFMNKGPVSQSRIPDVMHRFGSDNHLPSIHEKQNKYTKAENNKAERENRKEIDKNKHLMNTERLSHKSIRLPPINKSRPATPVVKSSRSDKPPSSNKIMKSFPMCTDACSPVNHLLSVENTISRPASVTGNSVLPSIGSFDEMPDEFIRPVSVDTFLKLPPTSVGSQPISSSEYPKLPPISKLFKG